MVRGGVRAPRVAMRERGPRRRPDDAVGGELRPSLETLDAVQRPRAKVAVDRNGNPVTDEEELENGDIPADIAARQGAACRRAGGRARRARRGC